jgi:hypothetical protein
VFNNEKKLSRQSRDLHHAHDRAAADAIQFLASMAPAFLIRVRPLGCQTSASLLMITTRAFVGAYSGQPPRLFCFPEPIAQSDQFAKLSNESSCRFFDGGQPQFRGPHRGYSN